MYKCVLQREKEYENVKHPTDHKKPVEGSTIGTFTVYDEDDTVLFECKTVENAGPSTDTPKQDKRIVAREYQLYWTSSGNVPLPKSFKPKCISLKTDELPSFKDRRIHIHAGNFPQDTLGCILLNAKDNCNGTCSTSTPTVEKFYQLVKDRGIENFVLIVKEIED